MFGWFRRPVEKKTNSFTLVDFPKIIIYKDVRWLKQCYIYKGGNIRKVKRIKGFWDKKQNEIHTIQDEFVLGHEMFHLLRLIGDDQ